MISINKTIEALQAWIKSCETHEQCNTCDNCISFITPKLYDISQYQCDMVQADLREMLQMQALAVASGTTKSKQQRPPSDDEQQPTKIF